MKIFLKNHYLHIIFLISILVPLSMSVVSIYTKTMPFWFDPARDFLLALGNQNKLTLIGQPTGIPGLFYGPYWIWLLSLALYISKDPRIVQFLVLALPYFTIFPFILYKLRNVFSLKISITLWVLFIFAFLRYTIFPWNPHLAPLLVLMVFYFLITTDPSGKKLIIGTLVAGILTGLIGNFHISFDIGLVLGILLFFLVTLFSKINRRAVKIFLARNLSFMLGFVITFVPFLVFESRHGFLQIKTALNTLSSQYAVVGLKGLTHEQIIKDFFQVSAQLFEVSWVIGFLISVIGIILISYLIIRRREVFRKEISRLFILSFTTLVSLIFVYLTSKNPVWDYHFIGVEIILILIVGLVMKEFNRVGNLIILWVFAASIFIAGSYFVKPKPSILSYDTLGKKEYIVDLVNNDASKSKYTVFVYNPGIYSYDYSYLFNWMVGKDVPYDPGQIKQGDRLVYLVIQKTDKSIFQDYINYHTPNYLYKTTKVWGIADGTKIIRRELKSQ